MTRALLQLLLPLPVTAAVGGNDARGAWPLEGGNTSGALGESALCMANVPLVEREERGAAGLSWGTLLVRAGDIGALAWVAAGAAKGEAARASLLLLLLLLESWFTRLSDDTTVVVLAGASEPPLVSPEDNGTSATLAMPEDESLSSAMALASAMGSSSGIAAVATLKRTCESCEAT